MRIRVDYLCYSLLGIVFFFGWTPPKAQVQVGDPIEQRAEDIQLDKNFPKALKQVARNIGADPEDLLTVMLFETAGTLRPSIRGAVAKNGQSAVGLIQFMPSTAKGLGTSVEKLSRMSQVEQLRYVYKYFRGFKKSDFEGKGIRPLYCAVFAGKPRCPSKISDGYHTLEEAIAKMNRNHRPKAKRILGEYQ